MPTDTVRSRVHAISFILRAVAWSLGLCGCEHGLATPAARPDPSASKIGADG